LKILALSDEVVDLLYSPRLKDKFGDVDLVLGCGDVPFYYLEFVVTTLGVPLYYVHGNHDKPNQFMSDGRILNRAEGCEVLEGRAVAFAPHRPSPATLLIAGLGGCLRYNATPYHQYTQGEMTARALALAPALALNRLRHGRALDILITHAPPRGIHDAADPAHTGFDAFLPFMERARPRYLLHGHSHVYRATEVTETRYHATTVLNVYPYRLLEFDR
jgi:Icc-related predicted phosphoesterase